MPVRVLAPMANARFLALQPPINGFLGFDSLGRVLVHGGIANGSLSAHTELERYDRATDIWTTLSGGVQYQQTGVAYAIDGTDRLLFACGQYVDNTRNGSTARGFIYDPIANAWSSLPNVPSIAEWSTSVPQNRIFAFTAGDRLGNLWLIGGLEDSGDQDVPFFAFPHPPGPNVSFYTHTNVIKYDGASWSQVNQHPPTIYTSENVNGPDAESGAGVFDGRRIYVLQPHGNGGWYFYDTLTDAWTVIATPPAFSGSLSTTTVDTSGNVYVITTGLTFLRYDAATDTWSTLAAAPVSGCPAIWFRGLLYVIGTSTSVGTMYSFDPLANVWSTLTDVLSIPRTSPGLLADGGGIYIIGGLTTGSVFSNVVEYWVAPPASGAFAQIIGF